MNESDFIDNFINTYPAKENWLAEIIRTVFLHADWTGFSKITFGDFNFTDKSFLLDAYDSEGNMVQFKITIDKTYDYSDSQKNLG